MFSVAHGQSKTNINLCRQGMIQLRRTSFYRSLFITCCHSTTLEVQTLSQTSIKIEKPFLRNTIFEEMPKIGIIIILINLRCLHR